MLAGDDRVQFGEEKGKGWTIALPTLDSIVALVVKKMVSVGERIARDRLSVSWGVNPE